MMPTTLTWLRATAVLALATQATAQQCYYPNGSKAPEKPCSSAEGSACCPDKWECLDNGMCHYPADDIYGRYSCTDKDWNSPGCPSNLCTYGMTGSGAGGGENMRQCSSHNDDWCCNANAVDVDCCREWPEPRPFFVLQDGRAYATVGSDEAETVPTLSTITGMATSGGGGGSSPSRTSAPESSDAASSAGSRDPTATAESVSTTATPSPFTSVATSVSSGSTGLVTVVVTSVLTPTANPTGSTGASSSDGDGESNSDSGSKTGLIVGCAVGIPLALALVGIIFWMLRKRRNQKANSYEQTPDMASSPGFMGGAAGKLGKKQKFRHSGPGAAEIDGNPLGAGRPISNIKGHAELPSGNGTPHTPNTVELEGGNGYSQGRNTWGSVPPQYSPAHNQTAFSHHPEASELDGTSVLPVINEKEPPQQQQYQAYRPPQPVAEMPTVTTPPEDLEKQVHHR